VEGTPFTLWHVFDLLTPDVAQLPYRERYSRLSDYVRCLQGQYADEQLRLRVVPCFEVNSMAQLNELDDLWLEQGYEGSILRDPLGMHKQGRSTVREAGLLRIKRFIEEDAVVLSITEGQRNDNEAFENELGQTARSTHAENMVFNGMVGSLECRVVKTGQLITVGPGCMSHESRKHYFSNPDQLIGQTIKYKFFPKGIKDKPRFPTFQAIRSAEDISG
jgi:DNA ligase-1